MNSRSISIFNLFLFQIFPTLSLQMICHICLWPVKSNFNKSARGPLNPFLATFCIAFWKDRPEISNWLTIFKYLQKIFVSCSLLMLLRKNFPRAKWRDCLNLKVLYGTVYEVDGYLSESKKTSFRARKPLETKLQFYVITSVGRNYAFRVLSTKM